MSISTNPAHNWEHRSCTAARQSQTNLYRASLRYPLSTVIMICFAPLKTTGRHPNSTKQHCISNSTELWQSSFTGSTGCGKIWLQRSSAVVHNMQAKAKHPPRTQLNAPAKHMAALMPRISDKSMHTTLNAKRTSPAHAKVAHATTRRMLTPRERCRLHGGLHRLTRWSRRCKCHSRCPLR